MDRDEVAEVFENIATLLQLKGENPFKARAYTSAARMLLSLSEPLSKLVAEDRLGEIEGVGEALRKKIIELVTTGRLAYYEELRAATPPGLLLMLEIPGLGPKKIRALHDELRVETIEQLEEACRTGKVAKLQGFGEKTQTRICEGIARRRLYASLHLLSEALPIAEEMLDDLRSHPDVTRCGAAGGVRRHCELISEVQLIASSRRPVEVFDFFIAQAGTGKSKREESCVSMSPDTGISVRLRVVSDSIFAAALLWATGSDEHKEVLKALAKERGLWLGENGLFRSKVETTNPKLSIPCATEEEVYATLGLAYVPPEMREARGEIQLAQTGPLPRLLEWTDLKGSLHNHSTWSDGHQRPEDIARTMRDLGLAYWGITDHSRSSWQANGLDANRVRQQAKEIAKVNQALADEGSDFRLLTGCEVDILSDGRLDFADDLLAELDVVIASIHQGFSQNEAETTRRLIQAAQNPYVHMIGHLSGRRLLERDGYKVNHNAVIDACAETGTWIELNASPIRFDMDWRYWPYARSKGVKCVINCDAHRVEEAWFLRLGAGIARKGGLTRADVVNTLPLEKLQTALRKKRQRG